jgi:hypothetical protein
MLASDRIIRRTVVLVTCALVLVLGPAPAMAIPHGEPTTEHPYVGVVALAGAIELGTLEDFIGPTGLDLPPETVVYPNILGFSGVLVDEHVLLTAAHGTGTDLEALLGPTLFDAFQSFHAFVTFEAHVPGGPGQVFLTGPDTPGWFEGEPVAHPDFDDFAAFPATFDIGAVLFEAGLDLGALGMQAGDLPEIADIGYLDRVATGRDRGQLPLTVVGYGAHDSRIGGVVFGPDGTPSLDLQLEFDDHRAVGEVRLVNLQSAQAGGHNLQHSGNPGRWSGGTCYGDSGGPVLHGNTLVGLTSFGTGGVLCRGNTSFAYRVDIQPAHDFMEGIGLLAP